MTALMAAPAAAALTDMHRKPATDRPWLGQLVLILELDPLLANLPTALAPLRQRRVNLLIDLARRLAVSMPTVLITGPPTRPARTVRRLPTRERRRLPLPRPPRFFQQALQLPNPVPQPVVLTDQPPELLPQPLVLRLQRRAPRRQPRHFIHRLGRDNHNL